MVHFFDITKFNLYKEDNRREVKKSNGQAVKTFLGYNQ